MKYPLRVVIGVPIMGLLLALAGCGREPASAPPQSDQPVPPGQAVGRLLPALGRDQALHELREIGRLYQLYLASSGKPPAKLEDWQELKKDYSKGYQALAEGRYVFIWGADPESMSTTGPANTILAYEKDAPVKGGVVLLGDGSVKNMSLQEFQATAKAKGG